MSTILINILLLCRDAWHVALNDIDRLKDINKQLIELSREMNRSLSHVMLSKNVSLSLSLSL